MEQHTLLRITTKKDGFRRAGRAWSGVTEVSADDFTDEQLQQLREEPMLRVEAIEQASGGAIHRVDEATIRRRLADALRPDGDAPASPEAARTARPTQDFDPAEAALAESAAEPQAAKRKK